MVVRSPRTSAARALVALVALVAMSASGCGSSSSAPPAGSEPSTPAPRVFVGEVSGSDARVGVVATPSHARLYFCGGDASFGTMTHWFPGVALDGARALVPVALSDGWSLTGQVDDAGASGEVAVPDAGTFSFHASPVSSNTVAGLYEVAGPCGHVGVVVTQASPADEPTGQGACIGTDVAASVEQVNPIRPIAHAADGTIPVVVNGTQLTVHAAAAP